MAEDARSPALVAIDADLASPSFKAGIARGLWRLVESAFPAYVLAVTEHSADGQKLEHFFRFELDGFPAAAPKVFMWDIKTGQELAAELRPRRNRVQEEAFKAWGERTVYRPWDRCSGAHNNWNTSYPELAWNPTRNLSFVLNDLYQVLNRGAN